MSQASCVRVSPAWRRRASRRSRPRARRHRRPAGVPPPWPPAPPTPPGPGKSRSRSSSETLRTLAPRNGSDSTRFTSSRSAEGFAHGRLARPQLLRDPRLHQAITRFQLAAQDPLEQDLLHLLAQDRPRDDAHNVSPGAWLPNGAIIGFCLTYGQATENRLTGPMTGFVSVPIPSISNRHLVAGLSRRFGFLNSDPGGPAGVKNEVTQLECRGQRRVADSRPPRRQVRRGRVPGDLALHCADAQVMRIRISDAGTSGPTGNVSGDSPRVHWPSAN